MKRNTTGAKGIGDILKGLGELVEKLSDIDIEAGSGQKPLQQEFRVREDSGRGSLGVSIRTAIGGSEIAFERFDRTGREPDGAVGQSGHEGKVEEVREPLLDVFEEDGQIVLVAEMPGVTISDVKLSVEGDLLTVEAARGDRRYRKELQLPVLFEVAKAALSANNGVITIRLPR